MFNYLICFSLIPLRFISTGGKESLVEQNFLGFSFFIGARFFLLYSRPNYSANIKSVHLTVLDLLTDMGFALLSYQWNLKNIQRKMTFKCLLISGKE